MSRYPFSPSFSHLFLDEFFPREDRGAGKWICPISTLGATRVRNCVVANSEFRESRDPTLQIQRSLRSDRLNRDNPGERSEHTSPVSRIITLFRSKPRYRPLAIPRNSSSIPRLFSFSSIHVFSLRWNSPLLSPFFYVGNNFALSSRSIGFPGRPARNL